MSILVIIVLILIIGILFFKLINLRAASSSKVTEEEIKAIINEGTESGTIEEIEQDIVENLFNMSDRRIGTLMTPRIDITWLDLNEPDKTTKEKIKQSIHTCFPVCSGSIDKILGVVFVKDLLASQLDNEILDLKKHIKPPLYIPENIKVFKVLEKFKESKIHFAVVVDEFGGVIGVVTMNDLLDVLMDDVGKKEEEETDIVKRADGTYLVDSSIPFPDFVRYFEIETTDEQELNEYNTLGGLVFNLAREIPKTGAKFFWKGFSFEVIDMDGRRIDKLLVKREQFPSN